MSNRIDQNQTITPGGLSPISPDSARAGKKSSQPKNKVHDFLSENKVTINLAANVASSVLNTGIFLNLNHQVFNVDEDVQQAVGNLFVKTSTAIRGVTGSVDCYDKNNPIPLIGFAMEPFVSALAQGENHWVLRGTGQGINQMQSVYKRRGMNIDGAQMSKQDGDDFASYGIGMGKAFTHSIKEYGNIWKEISKGEFHGDKMFTNLITIFTSVQTIGAPLFMMGFEKAGFWMRDIFGSLVDVVFLFDKKEKDEPSYVWPGLGWIGSAVVDAAKRYDTFSGRFNGLTQLSHALDGIAGATYGFANFGKMKDTTLEEKVQGSSELQEAREEFEAKINDLEKKEKTSREKLEKAESLVILGRLNNGEQLEASELDKVFKSLKAGQLYEDTVLNLFRNGRMTIPELCRGAMLEAYTWDSVDALLEECGTTVAEIQARRSEIPQDVYRSMLDKASDRMLADGLSSEIDSYWRNTLGFGSDRVQRLANNGARGLSPEHIIQAAERGDLEWSYVLRDKGLVSKYQKRIAENAREGKVPLLEVRALQTSQPENDFLSSISDDIKKYYELSGTALAIAKLEGDMASPVSWRNVFEAYNLDELDNKHIADSIDAGVLSLEDIMDNEQLLTDCAYTGFIKRAIEKRTGEIGDVAQRILENEEVESPNLPSAEDVALYAIHSGGENLYKLKDCKYVNENLAPGIVDKYKSLYEGNTSGEVEGVVEAVDSYGQVLATGFDDTSEVFSGNTAFKLKTLEILPSEAEAKFDSALRLVAGRSRFDLTDLYYAVASGSIPMSSVYRNRELFSGQVIEKLEKRRNQVLDNVNKKLYDNVPKLKLYLRGRLDPLYVGSISNDEVFQAYAAGILSVDDFSSAKNPLSNDDYFDAWNAGVITDDQLINLASNFNSSEVNEMLDKISVVRNESELEKFEEMFQHCELPFSGRAAVFKEVQLAKPEYILKPNNDYKFQVVAEPSSLVRPGSPVSVFPDTRCLIKRSDMKSAEEKVKIEFSNRSKTSYDSKIDAIKGFVETGDAGSSNIEDVFLDLLCAARLEVDEISSKDTLAVCEKGYVSASLLRKYEFIMDKNVYHKAMQFCSESVLNESTPRIAEILGGAAIDKGDDITLGDNWENAFLAARFGSDTITFETLDTSARAGNLPWRTVVANADLFEDDESFRRVLFAAVESEIVRDNKISKLRSIVEQTGLDGEEIERTDLELLLFAALGAVQGFSVGELNANLVYEAIDAIDDSHHLFEQNAPIVMELLSISSNRV